MHSLHRTWYRELFAPSVTTGILRLSDLAGYRNGPIYIRKSMRAPLNREAVRDTMLACSTCCAQRRTT